MISLINEEFSNWEITLGASSRELTNEELLNRDYYRGRFASLIDNKHINNWE